MTEQTPIVIIAKEKLIQVCQAIGVSDKKAQLIADTAYLQSTRPKEKKVRAKRVRMPKLQAVLNPSSKYYDKTPELTKKLSLLLYTHQHKRKRYNHKRIDSTSRQWVLLVKLKQAILEHTGNNQSQFLPTAQRVLDLAEDRAKKFGRKNIYLTFIVGRLEEILDEAIDGLTTVVNKRERKVYRVYWKRRAKLTGVTDNGELMPGTKEHELIRQIIRLMKKYNLKANEYMEVHFKAFAVFNSFPRLKDLITDSAIDRLEQYVVGSWRNVDEPDSDQDKRYWDDIRRRVNK